MHKPHFYDLSFENLKSLLESQMLNPTGASKLFRWHYKFKKTSNCELEISKTTSQFIYETFSFQLPEVVLAEEAEDQTVKLLLKLNDGETIETVIIPFQNKYSICLSSQVGCAMKCSFCYTGTQGLKRHLLSHEIIAQVIVAWNWLALNRPKETLEQKNIKSIVFMGQGEPLHNFDQVKKAIEILLDQHGFSFGKERITISTAGFLPGLKRWIADDMPNVNIALSLHSPIAEKRNQLIPINLRYPLAEVLEEIEKIPMQKKQFITFEYLLIDEFNDSSADAHATAILVKDKKTLMNLIPFNPVPGLAFKRSKNENVQNFKNILESYHIPSMIRTTKGDDILAACGQLKSKNLNL